ncbi:g12192 [Coccomyxa viridis]|uniref:peptidylprolyl isomerase n=1 Tax=Coccomyxa viridis TaxID=1274662 RepID=A0ABP1GCE9_9CHLO
MASLNGKAELQQAPATDSRPSEAGLTGGLSTIEEETDDDREMVGPVVPTARKRRKLNNEQEFLHALPSAELYERSYMHREIVTHAVMASQTDFLITASADGAIKFWKKRPKGVEFAKDFRAHIGPVKDLALSHDGSMLVSIADDKSIKIFDVANIDMMAMLRLPFLPGCAAWIFKKEDAQSRLAVAERETGKIHIYDVKSDSDDALHSFEVHRTPVIAMRYNAAHDSVVSLDQRGMIEYWSARGYSFPEEDVDFSTKMDTDLYALPKAKALPQSLELSSDGTQFAIWSSDRRARVFWYRSGKLRRVYDESLEAAAELQKSESATYRIDPIDFGRRIAVEKELIADADAPHQNAIFDESGNFLLFSTVLGVKVVNLVTNRVCRILGKSENTERFLGLVLYQGTPGTGGRTKRLGAGISPLESDPMLAACAYNRQRLYLFSRREPPDTDEVATGRDVFNEKPTLADAGPGEGGDEKDAALVLPRGAVIHTTKGDITLKLFPEECPKTIENFSTHAKNGYYDGIIFHRVIKGFMLQTGDPLGDGTGGQSIWGGEFEDEFSRNLRHDRPFTVSMANAGPNSNGSQFFITTTAACPWLDNKHTVFGRVVKGADVVQMIEKTKTDRFDKPFEDIKMVNIDIKMSVD